MLETAVFIDFVRIHLPYQKRRFKSHSGQVRGVEPVGLH